MDNKILEQLKDGLVFLSMPYSSKETDVPQERYESALRLINYLMSNDVHVISPIITGHPVVERFNTPGNWDYWAQYCEKCISSSKYVLVYQLEGFDSSTGVEEELVIAKKLGKEIIYIDEDFNFIEPMIKTESIINDYGYFNINDLKPYHLRFWLRIYNETDNIEEIKNLIRISADAADLNRKLDWE